MSLNLPDYRVISKIGVGANSHLYRVEHLATRQHATAKYVKMREGMAEVDERKFIDQLRAEFNVGKVMDHPVLRKSYDLRYLRRRLRVRAAILLLEYVDGVSMGSYEFHRTVPEVLTLFKQVAGGLHAMHKFGYVHADMKPGNILVTPDHEAKLIDFGQCSAMSAAKERVQGTPDYMAPEQATRSVLDQRTDVFGLGATLYRVLTGQIIATEMNKTADVHAPHRIGRRREEVFKPIAEKLPTCVQRFVDECCRPEPVHRLADMRAVINRLNLVLAILERQGNGGTGHDHADVAMDGKPTSAADGA